jgi:hypothetical protein
VCTECANTAVCSLTHAFDAKRAPEATDISQIGPHAEYLCTGKFPFEIKVFVLAQDLSSQFCPQKMCRTSWAPACAKSQDGQAGPGVHTIAGPAIKTGTHLNLNRIKYLSQHKQACTHSFPQKVCKDALGHKMLGSHPASKAGRTGCSVDKRPCSISRQHRFLD